MQLYLKWLQVAQHKLSPRLVPIAPSGLNGARYLIKLDDDGGNQFECNPGSGRPAKDDAVPANVGDGTHLAQHDCQMMGGIALISN